MEKIYPITSTLIKALMDIKKIIRQDPNKESASASTLTLVNIYTIVEEAEKQFNLQHDNGKLGDQQGQVH